MRYVRCGLCGADDSREVYPATVADDHTLNGTSAYVCTSPAYGQHYRIVRCLRCSFVYANPLSDRTDTSHAYAAVEDPLYVEERSGRVLTFRRHLPLMHRVTGEPKGRKLLDVGAYTGIFVDVARQAGWDAEGVELSGWAVEVARRNGLLVRQGDLFTGAFVPASFDVITMWDMIEHVDDPVDQLAQAFRLLKPGGTLVVHTINIASLTAKVMGERWPWLMVMHLQYFTPVTLRAMLEGVGFAWLHHHTQGRVLRLGYLASRVTAAFGRRIGVPLEWLVATLRLKGRPVPINTLDVFTAYARRPG